MTQLLKYVMKFKFVVKFVVKFGVKFGVGRTNGDIEALADARRALKNYRPVDGDRIKREKNFYFLNTLITLILNVIIF